MRISLNYRVQELCNVAPVDYCHNYIFNNDFHCLGGLNLAGWRWILGAHEIGQASDGGLPDLGPIDSFDGGS